MKMTVGEILGACGGRLLCGSPEAEVTSVSADSRTVGRGALFVPIRGEKTDAHVHIADAFAAGAAATLTQEHETAGGPGAWIAVPDTLRAVQKIAAAYRKRFRIPVVGITGSVGKTTTKEMVALALSAERNVMKTEGNSNSQIGVPLTVFRLSAEHEAAVVEMGMSEFGEMGRLAEVVAPDHAVVTNIGVSHIGQLGSRENIMREKLHITDRFHSGSVLFLNGDDPLLSGLRGGTGCRTVWFGTQPWCDFRAEEIDLGAGSVTFRFAYPGGSGRASVPAPGMHMVLNALASLAVARELGVSVEKSADALGSYRTLAMRQQIRKAGGVTVIDDSYNASPDAVKSSLGILGGFTEGRRVAVLADMLELGDYSARAHYDVGVCAASAADVLVTVGTEAERIAEGARSARPDMEIRVFGENGEASSFLKAFLAPGDAVLVKGSRGMHTDRIVEEILSFLCGSGQG